MGADEIAGVLLGRHGPIEGVLLPWLCGLRRRPRKRHGAMLRGEFLYYDRDLLPRSRDRVIAQLCARHLLIRFGMEPAPEAVDYLATALIGSPSREVEIAERDGGQYH